MQPIARSRCRRQLACRAAVGLALGRAGTYVRSVRIGGLMDRPFDPGGGGEARRGDCEGGGETAD